MVDVIGKRRIFYALSLALTIPGLVFILLTPFTDAGLQFTIDYTGGTRWEIKFADPAVTPDQVEEVFAANDLEATAVRTSTGYIEIKTEGVGLRPAPAPTDAPGEPDGPTEPVGVTDGAAVGAGAGRRPTPSVLISM